MDSSKPESSTESSSSAPTKPSENELQKDTQAKPASVKFALSSHSSSQVSGVGSVVVGTPVTTSTTETSKVSAAATSLAFASTTTTTSTSTVSTAPQSVTISLGVGALQVVKPHQRIPSPPKPVTTTAQDVTPSTINSSVSSLSSSASAVANKDSIKSTGGVLATTFTASLTSSSISSSQSVTDTNTPTTPKTSQSESAISNSSSTPPVASETTTTGGASTANSASSSAMKRPPSDITPSNPVVGSVETGDSETGTEHKRKKMRKETTRSERSNSPGSGSSSVSLGAAGRSIRNMGSKQGAGGSSSLSEAASNIGEFSGKTSSIFSAKSGDTSSSTQEKGEENNKNKNFETAVSSSSVGSASSAGNTSVSGNQSGSSFGSTSGNGGGGPKVPPLKIVLQPHSHTAVTTASTTGGTSSSSTAGKNIGTEETSQSTTFGSSSVGFSYMVSSTTADSSNGNSGPSEAGEGAAPNTSSSSLKATSQSASDKELKETISDATKDSSQSKVSMSSSSSVGTTSNTSSDPSSAAPTTAASTHTTSPASISTSAAPSCTYASNVDKSKDSASITAINDTPSSLEGVQEKSKLEEENRREGTHSQSANVATAPSTLPSSSTSQGISHAASVEGEREKEGVKEKEMSSKETGSTPKEKEKPVRVTRSSQRILKEGVGSHTPNSPSSSSPKTSACPSPSHTHLADSQVSAEPGPSHVKPPPPPDVAEKMDTSEPVELHPRKRKIKNKDVVPAAPVVSNISSSAPAAPTANAAATSETADPQQLNQAAAAEQPMLNCFEMYLNIRKQIDRRRRNLFPVTPKPPKGFKDYLMNRGTYVLSGNSNALAIPLINPTQSLVPQMKEFFSEQEKDRHKLRLQHLVEKEKLVLSVEQEILRVHGRAARALSNQTLPFSVCTILKDQEVYNLLTPEQEEKDINARSRYNGRLFLSWLQDVDDKWDKIKEFMLLRHHNEAESLHAVQKMDWEWKLKELSLCEPKANPVIDELSVPMVHVSDDFDLLPA